MHMGKIPLQAVMVTLPFLITACGGGSSDTGGGAHFAPKRSRKND